MHKPAGESNQLNLFLVKVSSEPCAVAGGAFNADPYDGAEATQSTGDGSAVAGWWQAYVRSTGQRKDAMVDPSTGQIGQSLPPEVILTVPTRTWPTDALVCVVSRQQLPVGGAGVLSFLGASDVALGQTASLAITAGTATTEGA
jgi:hypothetical protein